MSIDNKQLLLIDALSYYDVFSDLGAGKFGKFMGEEVPEVLGKAVKVF